MGIGVFVFCNYPLQIKLQLQKWIFLSFRLHLPLSGFEGRYDLFVWTVGKTSTNQMEKLDPCNKMHSSMLSCSKVAGQAKTRQDRGKKVADLYILQNFINIRQRIIYFIPMFQKKQFLEFQNMKQPHQNLPLSSQTPHFFLLGLFGQDGKIRRAINALCKLFSINQIQRRNQMSFNYSESIFDQIPQELDQFLLQTHPHTLHLPAIPSTPRFKKEIEVFTPVQAREALLRLIEKNKACSGRKNWKVDETNYLLFVVGRYCLAHGVNSQDLQPSDWHRMAKLIPNRDSSACEFRYLSLCPSSITHAPWSNEQRKLLLRIIQNQNPNGLNWKRISEKLYYESKEKAFRTGKQCREHYTCFLRPNLKKGAWTDEEDYELMSLFLKLGKKWSKMTNFIDGRNQNSIKNRFFLMFESKSQMRYSNSDLVKMVRRRMEKISKKITINQEEKCLSEQNINLTPTNSQSSNFEIQRQNYEPEQCYNSTYPDGIFFNDCHNEPHSQTAVKADESELFADEEFERYIDL